MTGRLAPRIALAVALSALAAPAAAGAGSPVRGAYRTFASARAPQTRSTRGLLHAAGVLLSGRRGGELTPVLKDLALRLPRLRGADRAHALRLLARPTQGQAQRGETAYTTAEHNPPLCSAHFCIHWVDTTKDAPRPGDANGNGIPDYVESVDAVMEHVYQVENVQLGWQPPKPDGTRGGNPLTDVYLKDVGPERGAQGIYGYSAPDPRQRGHSQEAYLVLDNDYSQAQFPRYGGNFMPPLEVTAAHEYNHILQFNYDAAQDTWMFEASAVWMEDKVYTEVNDYLQYLTPWSKIPFVPITRFDQLDSSDPYNVKVYGDTVWNKWIDDRLGADTIRAAWEDSLKTKPKSFAPGAYDMALRAKGTSFFNVFTQFAADTAEWRDANTAFDEGASFPDMARTRDSRGTITLQPDHGGARGRISHAAYALISVAPTSLPRIKLVGLTPHGVRMAIALVGRVGDEQHGTSTVLLRPLVHGGAGTVTLANPGQFARITAVVANGDARTTGRFLSSIQDWQWSRDRVPVDMHISTDFTPPSIVRRTPHPGARRVRRSAHPSIRFSEAVGGASSHTVVLMGPGHHRVRAKVRVSHHQTRVAIVPRRRLRGHTRYTIRLSASLLDGGGQSLPAAQRSWTFSTGR